MAEQAAASADSITGLLESVIDRMARADQVNVGGHSLFHLGQGFHFHLNLGRLSKQSLPVSKPILDGAAGPPSSNLSGIRKQVGARRPHRTHAASPPLLCIMAQAKLRSAGPVATHAGSPRPDCFSLFGVAIFLCGNVLLRFLRCALFAAILCTYIMPKPALPVLLTTYRK